VGGNLAVGGGLGRRIGGKSGGAEPYAGCSGGKSGDTGQLAGCPAARRIDSTARQKLVQNTSLAAPPDWPGLPPDGPAVSLATPDSAPN
jgi:hypothetical protein